MCPHIFDKHDKRAALYEMPEKVGPGVLKVEVECVFHADRIQGASQKHFAGQRNIQDVGALFERNHLQQSKKGRGGNPRKNAENRRITQRGEQDL
jgi:hypothetical protein